MKHQSVTCGTSRLFWERSIKVKRRACEAFAPLRTSNIDKDERDPQPMNACLFTFPPPVCRRKVITAPLSPGCKLGVEPSQEHVHTFPSLHRTCEWFPSLYKPVLSKGQHFNPPFLFCATNKKWGASFASGMYRSSEHIYIIFRQCHTLVVGVQNSFPFNLFRPWNRWRCEY